MTKKTQNNSEKLCECLKGIIHPTRLTILTQLGKGSLSVGELEKLLGDISQSNLSQHLSSMRVRGIVQIERRGNQIFYSVTDKRIFKLLDLIKELFCK